MKRQIRKGSDDDPPQLGPPLTGKEMEHNVLGTRGVLQNGEHPGDGAAEVSSVEGHGYVNDGGVVRTLGQRRPRSPGASHAVPKCRRLAKRRQIPGRRHSLRKTKGGADGKNDEQRW